MTNPTTAGLVKAMIIEAEESGATIKKKEGGISIPCMFNPEDYTIAQSNTYQVVYENGSDVPKMEFSGAGERSLKLNTLYFDTYESKKDVTQITRKLFALMKPSVEYQHENETKKRPSPVIFRWGMFKFFAVITTCSQKFTMFLQNGLPVRAEVQVEFKQHLKTDMYLPQNPTSGGGPVERIWQVKAGDRLDLIAAQVYRDATIWRLIADRNQIVDPMSLRAGQNLRIPPKSARFS